MDVRQQVTGVIGVAHDIQDLLTECPRCETLVGMKRAYLHPKARVELQDFPEDVKRDLGKAIFDLQRGSKLTMPLSRPMPSVGTAVEELRVKDRNGAYRVFYYTKSADAILVFHAFVKKSQKTPQSEIEIGKKRLQEMLHEKK